MNMYAFVFLLLLLCFNVNAQQPKPPGSCKIPGCMSFHRSKWNVDDKTGCMSFCRSKWNVDD
ncbi:unnamed protein product [Cylicocyclus nassatus]|uniref:Uncharacterized protein n=1 Tax=Cylicocyclus nassatus TaxID=53992 RepID=A0AA36M590_CYLNA|nr:unnamed protein product [Cylicocyclus nassatus]